MPSQDDLIAFLNEHVSYELLMLRYTRQQLPLELHPLDWNAKFESYFTHARLLCKFFSGTDDNRNIAAHDYVADFSPSGRREMEGLLLKLDQQIFHLGKQRAASERKLSIDDVDRMSEWLEKNAANFITALPEPYKKSWNSDHADPSKLKTTIKTGKGTGASAHPISLPKQSNTAHVVFTAVVSQGIKPRDPR
jgi:hypothetical protein